MPIETKRIITPEPQTGMCHTGLPKYKIKLIHEPSNSIVESDGYVDNMWDEIQRLRKALKKKIADNNTL